MERKRRIAILGATGSIGRQTLDVIRQHPDRFEVALLTANDSAGLLVEQAVAFDVPDVVICNETRYAAVAEALSHTGLRAHAGIGAVCDLVTAPGIDIVVAAMVGFSGLRPTVAAISAGKDVALANKETLVAAGSLVMDLAARHGVRILPVDSEHSAIFQCLLGAEGNPLHRIHLTASGGPFRTWPRERIAVAPPDAALRHPNWSMGAKITIDSATMMNKGFEVIEARWLFGTDPGDIHVVVHPESVIHSMVEFVDGSVIAQLGCPDMRLPIQLALSYPERLPLDGPRLDLTALSGLHFHEPDRGKFPALQLAFDAIARGGNIPCALNAANEVAVAAYLAGRIGFYDISDIVASVMAAAPFIAAPGLDDIFATDAASADAARALLP